MAMSERFHVTTLPKPTVKHQNRSKEGTDCEIAPVINTTTGVPPSTVTNKMRIQHVTAISLSVFFLRHFSHDTSTFQNNKNA